MIRKFVLCCLLICLFLTFLANPAFSEDASPVSGIPEAVVQKSGWQLQNRLPTSEALSGIYFINNKEGWAAGGNGIVLHTTDGGKKWSILAKLQEKDLLRLYFYNSEKGIALCNKGSIIRTEDGGKTWKAVFSDSACNLNTIQVFQKENRIIVSGYKTLKMRISPFILFSEDKGVTWVEQEYNWNFPFSRYQTHLLWTLSCFIDDKSIVVGDDHNVFLSKNGGRNWNRVHEFDQSGFFFTLSSIFFIDNKHGIIFRGHNNFTTSDGGMTWKKSTTDLSGDHILTVAFSDERNGIAAGYNNHYWGSVILKTSDRGKNWNRVHGFENVHSFLGIVFTDDQNGWISGTGGAILHTKDGGNTWKSQTAGFPQSFKDGFFIDKNAGWIIGGEFEQSKIIIHTVDGGKTWKQQYENKKTYLNSITFTDKNCGWVTGDEGLLLHTVNGGETWNRENLHTNENLFKIYFVDEKIGWILGKNDVYKTENGGNDWFKVDYRNELPKNRFRYFYPLSRKIWWMYDDKNRYETRDGGLSWKKIDYSSFYFNKSEKGWKISRNSKDEKFDVYITENLGESWMPIGKFPTNGIITKGESITDIFFIDSNIGYIITGGCFPYTGSNIYKTTDGGKTWTHRNPGTKNLLKKIFFVDPDNGWIMGDFGTILHTTTGGE